MKKLVKYLSMMLLVLGSSTSQAMNVWVVESGQDPFSNLQDTLSLSVGTNSLDLYYDVSSDVSYGYDLYLDVVGTGSISNVGGGDSELGNAMGTGWRQLGGSIYGEAGSSVLAFSFDFTSEIATSLIVSGSYTDANFLDASISTTNLAAVPVPAAVWLFGSGLIGLAAVAKRRKV